MQPTKFEFVINLKTSKALGVKFSDNLMSLARRGHRINTLLLRRMSPELARSVSAATKAYDWYRNEKRTSMGAQALVGYDPYVPFVGRFCCDAQRRSDADVVMCARSA
jgi:hypothetical protein